jgi:hypothetical protein
MIYTRFDYLAKVFAFLPYFFQFAFFLTILVILRMCFLDMNTAMHPTFAVEHTPKKKKITSSTRTCVAPAGVVQL